MSAAGVASPAAVPAGAASTPRHPSLLHYAVAVLETHHHVDKAMLTIEAAKFYRSGATPLFAAESAGVDQFPKPPAHPARPTHLTVVDPWQMPPAKKGVDNHQANKLRLIHSLAHIESFAIDLSWDILVRFATKPDEGRPETEGVAMPKEFYDEWLRVALDEAKHFLIWNTRLEEFDSSYGALPVHNGLWQSAEETAHSLLARCAVVHAVHEARGLDQAPKMLQQLMTCQWTRRHTQGGGIGWLGHANAWRECSPIGSHFLSLFVLLPSPVRL